MSSPRTISISHRLFRCRYSNSRDVVASSPSFSRPAARAPRRPCLRAKVRPIYAVPPSHRKKYIIQRCFKRKLIRLFYRSVFWTYRERGPCYVCNKPSLSPSIGSVFPRVLKTFLYKHQKPKKPILARTKIIQNIFKQISLKDSILSIYD